MTASLSTYKEVHDLAIRFGTPFYLFHAEEFLGNCHKVEMAFRRRYKNFLVGYSYKSNYIPYLCRLARDAGYYAEVVSRLEYDLALKVGQRPDKIIFNGPVKSHTDIELALANKSLVNLDSRYEIDYVVRYAKKHPSETIEVGLRVNIDLTAQDGTSEVQAGLASSRFGFEASDANDVGIYAAIEILENEPNISVVSLHAHGSSSSRALWIYDRITRTLCDIVEKTESKSVRYIDVGGGIFGKIPREMCWKHTPDFDDYAETICTALKSYPWVKEREPTLILEPGVAVAASCMSFVSSIIDVKQIKDDHIVLVDGNIYNVKPSKHKHNQPYSFIRAHQDKEERRYRVCGNTCMEDDLLLDNITANIVQRGDYLKIEHVGAYSVVMCPPFITTAPPILAEIEGGYKELRKKQDFHAFFADYSFQ